MIRDGSFLWFLSKQTTLDFTNYYLNLTEVNHSNKPVWQKEYSAKVMSFRSKVMCDEQRIS